MFKCFQAIPFLRGCFFKAFDRVLNFLYTGGNNILFILYGSSKSKETHIRRDIRGAFFECRLSGLSSL